MSRHEFDVVVLGGGSGGYAAAIRASELGKRLGMRKTLMLTPCMYALAVGMMSVVFDEKPDDEKNSRGATDNAFGLHLSYVVQYVLVVIFYTMTAIFNFALNKQFSKMLYLRTSSKIKVRAQSWISSIGRYALE